LHSSKRGSIYCVTSTGGAKSFIMDSSPLFESLSVSMSYSYSSSASKAAAVEEW
jgi:hypothetical protein